MNSRIVVRMMSSAPFQFPKRVKIFEVGPRDGLQNEKQIVPLSVKANLIEKLARAGITNIEVGSFVSPKWVPQMADTSQLFSMLNNIDQNNINLSALTPNIKGFEDALKSGVKEIAVFGAASESFSMKNINSSIADSLVKHQEVCDAAKRAGIRVRGYVSCVLGCPYEGAVSPAAVVEVTQRLFAMGCYEVSLGDTIGTGNPLTTSLLLEAVLSSPMHRDGSGGGLIPADRIAVHFHDTHGMALANILVALQRGVSVIDASVSGLGGCPYAGGGATGNVATEDVVCLLQGMGVHTGVDLGLLVEASSYIDAALGRGCGSKAAIAWKAKRAKSL